ncbi:hypothetical protein D3C72_1468170 [compost metagenome]
MRVGRSDYPDRIAAERARGKTARGGDGQDGGAHFQLAAGDQPFHGLARALAQGQVYAGMQFAESLHHRGEQQVDHRRNADFQGSAVQFSGLAQFHRKLPHGLQHLQAPLVHDLPGVGGAGGMPVADQQRRARFFLELADHLADGGLRDEQRLGRLREAGVPDRFHEIPQCAHVHGCPAPSRVARRIFKL